MTCLSTGNFLGLQLIAGLGFLAPWMDYLENCMVYNVNADITCQTNRFHNAARQ